MGKPTGTFETLDAVSYLEIPILIRYALPAGKLNVAAFAGPAVAIELSEQFKTTGSTETSVGSGFFKSTDFGAAFGVEVAVPFGPGHATFEARHTLGLADIGETAVGGGKVRNGATTLLLGYSFSPGR